jgi:hypothetical protein
MGYSCTVLRIICYVPVYDYESSWLSKLVRKVKLNIKLFVKSFITSFTLKVVGLQQDVYLICVSLGIQVITTKALSTDSVTLVCEDNKQIRPHKSCSVTCVGKFFFKSTPEETLHI